MSFIFQAIHMSVLVLNTFHSLDFGGHTVCQHTVYVAQRKCHANRNLIDSIQLEAQLGRLEPKV